MNIIFVGTPEFTVSPLQALIESEDEAVIRCLISPKSRKDRGERNIYDMKTVNILDFTIKQMGRIDELVKGMS